jgi:hypothetical protein
MIGQRLYYRMSPASGYELEPGLCVGVINAKYLIQVGDQTLEIWFQDACNYDPRKPVFDFSRIKG